MKKIFLLLSPLWMTLSFFVPVIIVSVIKGHSIETFFDTAIPLLRFFYFLDANDSLSFFDRVLLHSKIGLGVRIGYWIVVGIFFAIGILKLSIRKDLYLTRMHLWLGCLDH